MIGIHPLPSLLGGVVIGLAASALLLFNGRVAGISGIVAGLLPPRAGDVGWRTTFVAGLVIGGVVLRWLHPSAMTTVLDVPLGVVVLAGALVGAGTRLGSGCTSSRGSVRSLVATVTFMVSGAVTLFVVRHLLRGAW
jgi:hypothetical protein